jgi:protein phosphatase
MRIESFGHSDIGTVRPNNEDVIAHLPQHHFYVVADGMGGHKAGEVAAKEATDELCSVVSVNLNPKNPLTQNEIVSHLQKAISAANKKVYFLGQENLQYKGMGTTICCAYFYKDTVTYAHVGDSRIYLWRQNSIRQLTVDHSLITQLKLSGQIAEGEKLPPAYKNIITKAVGTSANIDPTINSEKYLPNDIFLMCTDGLSDYLSDKEITYILKNEEDKNSAVKRLIEAAKKNGSRDNISTLIVTVS